MVVVRTADRVLGSAAGPGHGHGHGRGRRADEPGQPHGGRRCLRPAPLAVEVTPAVPALADFRVLSDMLDPPVDPKAPLRRWLARRADFPLDQIFLSNVTSTMQGGVAFRATLHPDPSGSHPPPLLVLGGLRERALAGDLRGTLPVELWRGDAEHAAGGDVSVTHPYRMAPASDQSRAAAAVRAAAERVWADQPFTVARASWTRGTQPRACRCRGQGFSLQEGPRRLTSPAPRDLGPDRRRPRYRGCASRRRGRRTCPGRGGLRGRHPGHGHHPALRGPRGPSTPVVPQYRPRPTAAPPPRGSLRPAAAPATTTTPPPARPKPAAVRSSSRRRAIESPAQNCLQLIDDLVKVESGTLTEVGRVLRLCGWSLERAQASFEGVACSEEERDRRHRLRSWPRLDRPCRSCSVSWVRRATARSGAEPEHRRLAAAEQRLGAGAGDREPPHPCPEGGVPGQRGRPAAALAVSAFVVGVLRSRPTRDGGDERGSAAAAASPPPPISASSAY